MGFYLKFTKQNKEFSHDYKTDKWIIHVDSKVGKIRRLPHCRLWEEVTQEDIECGITNTSCVY